MSVKFMARVWAQSTRKDGELLVLLALADFANDAGEAWPSIRVLAEKARLTPRQCCRVLEKLEVAGEIRRHRSTGGRNKRNRYEILLPENSDKITLTKLQCKNYSEIGDTKTVTPVSYALNRHRTINKKNGAKAPELLPPKTKRKHTRSDAVAVAAFDAFYTAYPRHVARQNALRAWLKLSPDESLTATLMEAVNRYTVEVEGTESKYILHAVTWLNGRRWEDEFNPLRQSQPQRKEMPR